MNGLPVDRVAAILAESKRSFSSLSHLEGFGLPPVEAMGQRLRGSGVSRAWRFGICGRGNGFWCEEGNPVA